MNSRRKYKRGADKETIDRLRTTLGSSMRDNAKFEEQLCQANAQLDELRRKNYELEGKVADLESPPAVMTEDERVG